MIQEKKKHKKSKKKPSAMAQVHNRVNAGVMDGVVYGGMMEAAEPEDNEYKIGPENGGLEAYEHVMEGRKTIYISESQLRDLKKVLCESASEREKKFLKIYAINTYGTTDNFDSAGFILTTGELLDFGNYNEIYRKSHGALDLKGKNFRDFINAGNIRVNPQSPGIEFCEEPTDEQYKEIHKMISHYLDRGVFYVDCIDGDGKNIWNKEYRGNEIEHAINDIKDYFTKGTKPDEGGNEILMGYSLKDFLEEARYQRHVLTESPDVVDFYGLESRDSEARSFMYVLPNRKFYIGEPGETHDKMVERLEQSEPEVFEKFDSDGGDMTKQIESLYDLSLTGRYWGKFNIISFWKTPVSKRNNIAFVLNEFKKQNIINGTERTLLDYWDRPGEDKPMLFPVKWLFNGAFNTFVNYYGCTGIEPADAKCVEFKLDTKKHGILYTDINGADVKSMFEYYGYNNYEMDESVRSALSESKEHVFDYKKYIKSFIQFLRSQHLSIDPLPEIELKRDKQEGLFIKTGYYDPNEMKVVAYISDRHPKDVMRTIAHEFIHHMQNLQNPHKDWGTGGDLEADRKLRGIEGEAFLLGNIIFREWTEKMKKTKELNESKKRKKQVKNDKGEVVPETCDKCGGKVVVQIHGEPVYVCKDCGKYFGTMPCTLNEIASEIVEPDDVDLSSFNIKKHLNPKFWDDGHLDTRIRLKLLDIADDFFDSLGVDWVEPVDVIITGSIANYNWNKKYSDIDLHILVDYEDVDERVDFVREYFTLKKNAWNEKHKNLKIFGFPVEVYVQDANEPHASSGVYSIDKDEWLTEPDFDKLRSGKVDKRHVREMVSTYMNKIDCLIDIYKKHKDDDYEMKKVAKDASEMFDEIKKMRKDDLAKYGREMCDGNIIFKALRRSDYIGKLIKLKDLTYDKINSL